jgi:ABC-type Fe3+-siderophore transport system permease subunit
MNKPSAFRTLALNASAEVDDKCEMAKRAWNSASRGKRAYQVLVFAMAVALAVAVIFAVYSFRDDQEARGILALVGAAGSLLTGGVFATLAKSASDDEKAMWERVEKTCP